MEFKRTRDHDTIQEWIEEHGGEPVELQLGGDVEGLITINFGRLLPEDYRSISWREFFAWFDAQRLAFRYADEVEEGQEERSYNFISGKHVSDTDEEAEDETELPELSELAKENMYNDFDELPEEPDYAYDEFENE